jgi:hypothetical protein
MATLIKADGTTAQVEILNRDDNALAHLQELVGGNIEVLRLPDGNILVIDEEGKLKDKPYNRNATHLWWIALGYNPGDHLVGDVVVARVEHPGENEEKWI